MPSPFDPEDTWSQNPWNLATGQRPSMPLIPGASYWPGGNTPAQVAYDFWFAGGPGNAAMPTTVQPWSNPAPGPTSFDTFSAGNDRAPSWADPHLDPFASSGFSGAPDPLSVADSDAFSWPGATFPDANGQFPPLPPPPPLRLPYSVAAGGLWNDLASKLEASDRANGVPTDGLPGGPAGLPTPSDTGTTQSNQVPSLLSGPPDLPLSVSTLSNNFLPNGLPRFTGGPPSYWTGSPDPSASTAPAPANQSVLFQRPPSSLDLGANDPDTRDFGPDARNLADLGLPLTKSGTPYFPPPSPFLNSRAAAEYVARGAAQTLAPNTYDYFTDNFPPAVTANAAGKLNSPPDPFGIFVDALSLFGGGLEGGAAKVGLGAAERAALAASADSLRPAIAASQAARGAEAFPELITGTFADLEGKLPPGWQRHHVNQDGAFGKIVPYDEAFTVGMRGNILTEPGSPHYLFHRSMEDFWDQFRADGIRKGQMPTISEYHQAAQRAFVAAGFTPDQASYLVGRAAKDITDKGVSLSAQVPDLPRAIWRKRKM